MKKARVKVQKDARCCPPDAVAALPPPAKRGDMLAKLTKAMGHPARIRILALLMEREQCVCGEIVEHISLAQSTISQHLKVLKAANLITGEIDGPRVCYCVNRSTLAVFKELVAVL